MSFTTPVDIVDVLEAHPEGSTRKFSATLQFSNELSGIDSIYVRMTINDAALADQLKSQAEWQLTFEPRG